MKAERGLGLFSCTKIHRWTVPKTAYPEEDVSMGLREMSEMVAKAQVQLPAATLDRAGGSAGGFLMAGIERWEQEGRLEATEALALRDHLSSGQVQHALHHMGVHMALSMPIPIPGLQNLARLTWTVACWVGIQGRRFRDRVPVLLKGSRTSTAPW